ncbi:MAG: hypothetical protein IKD96_08300 [Oscillospiraceae bacterium]|nr:hypothetical protein [Oscillospiraceae bacterium]
MKRAVPFVLFPVAGVAAAVLRQFQLSEAYTSSGLPIPGQGSTLALLLLSLAAALGALIYSLLCRPKFGGEGLPACAGRSGCTVGMTVAGFLVLIGGALTAMESLIPSLRIAWMILAVLMVLSGALMVVGALQLKKDHRTCVGRLLLLPDFACCLWLVLFYQSNAADPILMDYVFRLLAMVCILLGLYFTTAQTYRLRRARRAAFFCLMGGYLSLLCLGEPLTLGSLALMVGFALYLFFCAGILTLGK